MKATIYTITGEKQGEMELPSQFSEQIREDLIKRAALAVMSAQHQAYGTDPLAGKRQGRQLAKRRHRGGLTTYGRGISRVTRKIMWKRGTQWHGIGARGGQAVKGMKSFPPKVEKIFWEKINLREKKKAMRSAVASTADRELVEKKHALEGVKSIPIVVEGKFEELKKTKDVMAALEKLGLGKELERIEERKVRAGKGKMRGRKYKRKTGALIIVSKECPLENSARNIPGIDVAEVKHLNAALLAPGAIAGRLAVWTKNAIELVEKEKLWQ